MAAGRIAAVGLALLLGYIALPARAEAAPYGISVGESLSGEARVVETAEALLAELRRDVGGVIGISGTGPLPLEDADIKVTQPVIVRMPQGGIEILEWCSVDVNGPVTFEGTRCFTLRERAYLALYNGSAVWAAGGVNRASPVAVTLGDSAGIQTDPTVTVRAEGAQAVAISADGDAGLYLNYARVSAAGDGATGIDCSGWLTLEQAFVKAEGDGACAIRCRGAAEFVQVSAEGAVDAELVTAALSRLSPPPENLVELAVEPYASPGRTIVYQGLDYGSEPVSLLDQVNSYFTYQLPASLFSCVAAVTCDADWDLGGLDYATPGVYTATAALRPIMEIPGMAMPPAVHEIMVMRRDRPALYIDNLFKDGEIYVVLYCLAPIPEAETVLLWLYEEDGWRELTASGQAVYAEEWSPALHNALEFDSQYPIFQVTGLEENHSYWVVAQAVGGPMDGFSNLRLLTVDPTKGGDRTGADREGTDRPTTLPPASGGNSGGISHPSDDGLEEARPTPAESTPAPVEKPPLPAQTDSGSTDAVPGISTAHSLPEEWEDDTTIAITGKRLLALIESDEPVTFINSGARIVVDREALLALELRENQLLTVVEERGDDTCEVRFILDGEPLDLPYMLMMPEQADAVVEAASLEALAPKPEELPAVPPANYWVGGLVGGAATLSGGGWLARRRLRRRFP